MLRKRDGTTVHQLVDMSPRSNFLKNYFAIWVANIQPFNISSKLILFFFLDGTAATRIYTFDNTGSFIIYHASSGCIST